MARARSELAATAPAELEPGDLVDGYRVERVLSVGPGRTVLVEAIGPSGTRVLLKLLGQANGDAGDRQHALCLVNVRASVEHPHLAPLLKAGEHHGRLYLVSELRGTTTLADRLAHSPMDAADALQALAGVAGALESAARERLVHAELTPRAILFTDQEPSLAYLTDFGIGRERARAHTLRVAVEGVDYQSPEEIRGRALRPESNAYSLACILHECLTGSPPYPYERPVLTMHAHLVEPPPRPSAMRSALPSELDEIVARGMAKDPSERLGCAELVLAAAKALGVEVEIPAGAPRREEKGHRRAKREQKPPAAARPRAKPPSPAKRRPQPPDRPKRVDAPTHATAPARPKRARGAHAAPQRRRGRRLRPVTTLVAIALAASAVSGFVLGRPDPASAPASTVSAQPKADPAALERAQYVRSVSPVIDRLSADRAGARRRLRRARRPEAQADAARALAQAYADAAKALSAQSGGGDLRTQLRSAESAYRRLAAAASTGNDGAWRAASRATVEHERRFERSLSTISSA